MAYGFDPSIILSGRQYTGPDAGEVARTLADLSMRKVQQQQAQATLADMARQQARQQALSGIYQQNTNSPEAVGSALMQGGFGEQAQQWMEGQAGIGAKNAIADKAKRGEAQERLDLLSRPLQGGVPKNQAELDQLHKTWKAAKLSEVELQGIPTEFSPETVPLFEKIRALGLSSEDAAKIGQRENELAARIADREKQRQMLLERGRRSAVAAQAKAAEKTAAAASKAEGKAQAADAKLAERNVGGFSFDPKNPPSADAAKKMAEAAIAKDKMIGALDRMEKLFDDHGTEAFGEHASSMESEWKQITDQVRIIQDMGVPNGADYPMLAKQIPNPTGWGSKLQSKASIKAKFPALRRQIEETVSATAKAYKYKPDASASSGSPFQTPPGAKGQGEGGAGTHVSVEDLLSRARGQ
jgi:hypothetical protein